MGGTFFSGHGVFLTRKLITFDVDEKDRPHVFSPISCKHLSYNSFTRSSAIAEGPRDASRQLKSCQLPCNSAETTYTTSPDQIDGMKLEI